MTAYAVTFERIGRHRPDPLTVEATNPDDLAEKVYKYARRFLGSRDVAVDVDLESGVGWISCGGRNGGKFTVLSAAAYAGSDPA